MATQQGHQQETIDTETMTDATVAMVALTAVFLLMLDMAGRYSSRC